MKYVLQLLTCFAIAILSLTSAYAAGDATQLGLEQSMEKAPC
ncbi:MAG: hypothetical protein AAF228_03930 [Pseudomonadota bacterium]